MYFKDFYSVTNCRNICCYYNPVVLGNFVINSIFLYELITFSLPHLILTLLLVLSLNLAIDLDILKKVQNHVNIKVKKKFMRKCD